MPYKSKKIDGWATVNKKTGKKLLGKSKSKEKAEARGRLVTAKEHGWRPTEKKVKKSREK